MYFVLGFLENFDFPQHLVLQASAARLKGLHTLTIIGTHHKISSSFSSINQ
jgi:hypothetical protein